MSTLKTNTIQHLTSGFNNVIAHTDGAGTANAVHARAWVNFNGTNTVTIRAQFNVSSITDNGTGDYTMNFANSMSDANYAAVGSCVGGTGTLNNGQFVNNNQSNNPATATASLMRFRVQYALSLANNDVDCISVTIFR